jgi:hypothetical protein
LIGENAQITSTKGVALRLTSATSKTGAVNSSIAIENNAKLKGATYAVEFVENANAKKDDGTVPMMSVSINGGSFAGGEDYIPISDSYYVTFPDGEVLNTAADGEGYHSLTTKDSLSGVYRFGGTDYPYTY